MNDIKTVEIYGKCESCKSEFTITAPMTIKYRFCQMCGKKMDYSVMESSIPSSKKVDVDPQEPQ